MKHLFWLLLLPSLAFAKWPASSYVPKDPIYIDVQPDQIVIYPDLVKISASDLAAPHNEFEKFLDAVEQVRDVRYSILVLRPGSVDLHRRIRQLIQDRGVDAGFEPVETGRDFMEVAQNPAYNLSTTSHLSADQAARVVEFFYSKRGPFEVEVRSNSLTILTNQVAVSREELQTAGNPFERYLDQVRAQQSQGPYSYRKEPGSDAFFAEVMAYAYEHGARKGVWDTVMAGIPIEVPANGRTPFYLECRGSQLFAIAADPPAAEFEISGLKSLDPATQYVCFLVRPDGFEIFRQARKAAWEHGLDVSCELQDESSPLAIGPEGAPLFPWQSARAEMPASQTPPTNLAARVDEWLSKAETFSALPFIPSNKSPVYVEIWPDRISISPEMPCLVATGDPEKDFESLFGRMEEMRSTHYFVLIPHPGGAIFQRRVRQQLQERGIDVTVQTPEPDFEAGGKTTMEFHGALPPRPVSEMRNGPPCDVEVRAEAITILSTRAVVTAEDLKKAGNAFECLLDQFESRGECPNIQLCEMPGGEQLKTRLGGQIFLAAKSMGCQMKIETRLQETDSSVRPSMETEGTHIFECRNGLLHDLADPGSEGHAVRFQNEEDGHWLAPKLAAIRHAHHSIHFTVHPDSFETYRNARIMAWVSGIPISRTVVNETAPVPPAGKQP